MIARRTRRMSSSLLPLNITPQITSIQPARPLEKEPSEITAAADGAARAGVRRCRYDHAAERVDDRLGRAFESCCADRASDPSPARRGGLRAAFRPRRAG